MTTPRRAASLLGGGSPFGDFFYQILLPDDRRYFFANPVTIAVRGLYFGRYGQHAEDSRLSPHFLGNEGLLHGYSFFSFDPLECGSQSLDYPVFDHLIGSRFALASLEARLSILGTEQLGLVSFPYLPTDLVGFVDGSVAWNSDDAPVWTRACRWLKKLFRTSNPLWP